MPDTPEMRPIRKDSPSFTPSTLRCLLAILKLSTENHQVASRSIAEALHVKPPSICRVLDILLKEGMIRKEPYGKVELTANGKKTAVELNGRVRKLQHVMARQLGLGSADSLQAALYFATSMGQQSQLAVLAHAAADRKGGDPVMPLHLAVQGEENIIRRIGGTMEVKKHLSDLGFVVGGSVSVISQTDGNMIVNVKESRIAISREMAQKIMI